MRKFKLALALLSTLVGASECFAEEPIGIDLSVYANYWDVKDGDDNVWGPGIGVSVPLYNNQLKFDLRTSWMPDASEDVLGDLELVPLDFGLSWHQNCDKPWDFYGFAGMSVVFADFDTNESATAGDIDFESSALGGYVGGGIRYDFIDNLGLFTNVYYRFAQFDVDTRGVTEFEGIGESETYKADGLNVDIGIAFTF